MIKESKNIVLLFLILFLLVSCFDEKEKINYRGSKEISKNLYLEFYSPGIGGVLASDIRTIYLTDSNDVNIYLFSMYDDESYDCEIDSLYFKGLKYRLVQNNIRKPPFKVYIDSIIIDIKTFKVVEK